MIVRIVQDPFIIIKCGTRGKAHNIGVEHSLFLQGGIQHPDHGENAAEREDPKDEVHQGSENAILQAE
jgi:hypothetical protein